MGSFGLRILAVFGQVLILRLVTKDTFGAYGALLSFPLMLLPLLPMGFDSLLIREKKRRRRYVVALTQTLAVLGTLLVAVAAGTAMLKAQAAGTGLAVVFLGLIFAVMATKLSIRSVHAADLDFRTISIGEFGNGMITYFGGAAAVFLVRQEWAQIAALMAAYLAGEVFEATWLYRGQRFRPFALLAPRRWRISRTLFRRHRHFCLTNTADLTLNNIASLIPAPMIAYLIGKAANGDFTIARMLIQLPILLMVGAIWRVAFPTLSGVSDEVLHSRCIKIIGTTAAFIAPAVVWLAFFAPTTAFFLGGEKYLTAAPIIRWMALYMLMTAIYSPISSLDMVRDRPEVGMYWNIVHTIARVAAIWWYANRGLYATMVAMSLVSMALWVVWVAILGWLLNAGWRRFTVAVLKFAPGWVLLAAGFWLCQKTGSDRSLVPVLLSAIPGFAYLGAIMVLFPEEAEMVWRLAGRKAKKVA